MHRAKRHGMLDTMARALGIDYGTKRIGVALSDETRRFAFPHAVVSAGATAVDAIVALVAEHSIDTIVLGHSHTLSGDDNPVMREARTFATALTEKTDIPVTLQSEVFTSQHALRQFETTEKTRKPKKRHTIDDSAAALILQGYLDTHHD